MTKQEAIELGRKDGMADVDNVLAEQGIAVVEATTRPGHLAWDEGAINAGAHRIAGVPDELRKDYYREYARAAAARACELVLEHQES